MKITAIQKALQELGFLPPTHTISDDWDSQTNAGYIQAAQANNMHTSLWAQPANPGQLPQTVHAVMYGKITGSISEPTAEASVNAENNAPALRAAQATREASAQEALRALGQQEANHKATVLKATEQTVAIIEKEVRTDASELETDADLTTPNSAFNLQKSGNPHVNNQGNNHKRK